MIYIKKINKFLINKPNIIPLILLFSFLPSIVNEFINIPDWDLYNNLYYGQRLLEGELLWTIEFHDKFPVLQYIFGIPAFFRSLFVWRLISFLTHLIASLFFYKTSIFILNKNYYKNKVVYKSLAKYIGLIFFLSPFFLNSFTHFSNTSSNLISISICIIILKFNNFCNKHFLKNIFFWISLVLISIATSIRPYYAPISIFIGLWIPIRERHLKNSRFNWTKKIKYFFCWNIILFLITILINFSPYIFTNHINTLIDGIILNAQDINPQSIKQIFLSQFYFLKNSNIKYLLLIVSIFTIYLILKINKEKHFSITRNELIFSPDFIFLGLFSPILLQIMIINKHFWSHYSLMFLPFISFFNLGVISNSLEKALLNKKKLRLRLTRFISLLFITVILIFESFKGFLKLLNYDSSDKKSLMHISRVINEYSISKYNKLSFIDFTGQRIHLELNQSREGLPHPAHIKHLEQGWYDITKINVPESFKNKFPLNINNLFSNLIEADTKLIIVNKEGKLNNSLTKSELFRKNELLTKQIQEFFDDNANIYERLN